MHSDSQRTLFSLAAVALSLLLAGCGGGGDGGSSSEAPEPEPESEARVDLCGLLTETEIEGVLGAAPGSPTAGDEGQGQCSWGAAVVVTLEEASLESFDDFVYQYGEEFGGENPPRDRFHPVDGIGDWAMYIADDDMVRAFRSDHALEVSAPDAPEEQVVELAKLAMPRLP